MKHGRLANLDLIRTIAILSVVIFAHVGFFIFGNYNNEKLLAEIINYSGQTNLGNTPNLSIYFVFRKTLSSLVGSDLGIFGVGLFFLLSGYLFSMQTEKKDPIFICIQRVIRISIPITIIYGIIFTFLIHNSENLMDKFSIVRFFAILKFPSAGILWTLHVELIFYIIFAIFRPTNEKRLILIFILFFIFLKSIQFIPYIHWVLFIFVGSAVRISKFHHFYFLISLFLLFKKQDISLPQLQSTIGVYIVFLLLLKVRLNETNILVRCSNVIAKISYSMYLIHMVIFAVVTYYLQLKLNISIGISCLVAFFVLIITSFMSYNLIEKPVITLGHFLVKIMLKQHVFLLMFFLFYLTYYFIMYLLDIKFPPYYIILTIFAYFSYIIKNLSFVIMPRIINKINKYIL